MPVKTLLRYVKFAVFGKEIRERRILAGAARNVVMLIDPAAKTQRIVGLDEREIQSTFVAFSQWADTLVDIGASDAYYGLVFRKHNPTGNVHLVDANADFLPLQQRHFALNFPGSQLDARTAFVTPPDRQGEGTILLSKDLPVAGRRVFFKIDVDGWELDVLKSAEALISITECRFIIETHSPELEQSCIRFLTAHGYRVTVIPNAWWRIAVPEQRPAHNRWISAVPL